MYKAETLILAVEKYPCLWNTHDKDYHNRDVKCLVWENVFKEVIHDWDMCTKVQKENRGAEVKKKWTHIRDYFRRDFQKNKNTTGSAAKKVKKYVYSHLLYFLIPVFDKTNTEENSETDYLDYNNAQDSETEEKYYLELKDEPTELQPPSPLPTLPATSLNRDKKYIPTQLSNLHDEEKVNHKRQDVEDDDTNFLLSFRTHMKHMNDSQKIDFKLGMLQLVKKINNY